MTKRIFRSVFLASLLVFLAGPGPRRGRAVQLLFRPGRPEQLRIEASLAATGRGARAGWAISDGLDDGEMRLTWIAADGTVIYDTDADAGEMENHAEREEFREALRYGTGEGERTSSTLSRRRCTTRCASPTAACCARRSRTTPCPALLMGIIQPLALILVLALLLSGWLASRLSKRIVGPLNAIDLDQPAGERGLRRAQPAAHPRGAAAAADRRAARRAAAAARRSSPP